ALVFSDESLLRSQPRKPARGWRRVVYTLTGGKVSPAPSPEELEHLRLIERVRNPVGGCRRIAVISRKGGVGKTTTTLMLGHTFALHRGDRIVALDGNPDAGSLGYRVPRETQATVTDLLDRAGALERYADVRGLTSQATTRLEVVASDDDPHISQAIGEHEYREAVTLLERHYNLILLDSGTGILDSATQGILRVADQLVVVMAPSIDGSRAAGLTLDWLDSHGYGGMVRGAVAVINQSRERGSLVEVHRIEDHFRSRCRDVALIPWDPHLEAGAQSDPDQLRPQTRDAYLRLAASVADGFTAR
ncbi:MAG: MinD/ParA family ATP-binding protein, partial [Egibacteraceae bacterium]